MINIQNMQLSFHHSLNKFFSDHKANNDRMELAGQPPVLCRNGDPILHNKDLNHYANEFLMNKIKEEVIEGDFFVRVYLTLKPDLIDPIPSSFDIEDVNDALARMKANEHFGKIILTLS